MADNPENYPEFKAYLKYSKASDVTRETLKRISNKFFTQHDVYRPFHMLDVGSSDGELSLPFAQWLKTTFEDFYYIAIEPEVPAFEKLNERIAASKIDWAETRNLKFEEYLITVENESEIFDLILLSQCIYYIPKEDWREIVAKSKRILKKNGCAIIILDSFEGQAYRLKDLITGGKADTLKFGDLYSAEDMENFLSNESVKYSTEEFSVPIYIRDNEQKLSEFARHLAYLYRTFPEKILRNYGKYIEDFLETTKHNDYYVLENLAKAIIFQK